ncbi:MAG: sulfatase family protein, partial [Ilumatobacteraceae bacterium]
PRWASHLAAMRDHSTSHLLTDEFVLAGARQYYAMVSLIDQRVGDLLALLERQGQLDDTWIVYCADHGEMLGDHGVMAKMNFYRSSVRVPLIIRPPGGTAGRVETAPVQAFDVAATLLEAGSAAALEGAPSRSLVPFVTGQGGSARDHAVSMIRMRPDLTTWQAITDGDWRTTFSADTGEASELFDLVADPDETANRVDDPTAADHLGRLRDQLAATLEPA